MISGLCCFAMSLGASAILPVWIPAHWPDNLRLAAAAFCVMGAGFGASLFYSATQTLIQLTVPHHLRGRVGGVWMIAFSSSVPLGALWTGRAASYWGVSRVMGLSAAACAAVGVLAMFSGLLKRRAEASDSHLSDDWPSRPKEQPHPEVGSRPR